MRVLIVSAWDPKSGVLTVYRSLAKHLGPRGVRFSAFAFDGWGDDTWWTFCDDLIDGRSITLAEVLMSGHFDLVHCVDTAYSPPYGVDKWVRRARFRGPLVLMATQVAQRQFTETVHATRYVACSRAAAELLTLDADGDVTVIPNGYDEDVFRPGHARNCGRPQLVWVGRSYDPQKGLDLFLDAAMALPEYDAVVVDAGEPSASLTGHLHRRSSRVQLRSLLRPDEMAEVFRTAAASGGAFLATSQHEAFNIAAVEAMACGCPVVASRIPGHEHLVDGQNALLFDRAGGVDGVVRALARLDDKSLRAKVVEQAASQAAEQWTSRAMADAYMELYLDALAETSARSQPRWGDSLARVGWRAALAVRPTWHRIRRSLLTVQGKGRRWRAG